MKKNDYIIRLERPDEHRQVENLVREAFWNVYRPGCLEHYVLNQLRDDEAFVKELDFVQIFAFRKQLGSRLTMTKSENMPESSRFRLVLIYLACLMKS